MTQQAAILCSHLLARRTVNKHAVKRVHLFNLAYHAFHAARAALLHGLAVIGWVNALNIKCGMAAAAHPHKVEFQAALTQQLVALRRYLTEQTAAHGARTTNKQVEIFVFTQEETVVQHINRFAQLCAIYHKRQVHLLPAHGGGIDADAVSSQHAEQLSGNASHVAHTFAHNRHTRQSVNQHGRIHGTISNLGRKFGIEQTASLAGVVRGHTQGRAGLRRVLCHHKHADAASRQSGKDATVHTNHTHHGQTAHRNGAGVLDR